MEFGVFDHLDRGEGPLAAFYERRLELIEAYDRAGFYGYHVAEHHATPLGMAPSPSVFLAAAAQRTTRLRLGTMVYALPLHHPLRMVEEICMLDHLSGGRLDIGFGRGSSPIELEYYGRDPEQSQQVYLDALALVLRGLTAPTLDGAMPGLVLRDVPMVLAPLQRPHPPVWYGVHSTDSAERAAERGFNIVCNEPATASRRYIDRFVEVWRRLRGPAALPRIGVTHFLVIDHDEKAALATARRAYRVWHDSFHYLFRRHGRTARISGGEADFDALSQAGKGVAGTPDRAFEFLAARLEGADANYCINRFAFGDLSLEESTRSVALFASEVMPRLAALKTAA